MQEDMDIADADPSVAEWSLLPEEVVTFLLQKFCSPPSPFKHVRLVCKSWRQTFDTAVSSLYVNTANRQLGPHHHVRNIAAKFPNLTGVVVEQALGLKSVMHELVQLPNLETISIRSLNVSVTSFELIYDTFADLSQLTNLHSVDASYNVLYRALPASIGLLGSLQRLSITHSDLRELPADIGSLTGLTCLDLDYNKELQGLPRELGNMVSLQHLSAKVNKLQEIPKEFSRLTALTLLDLAFNQITEIPVHINCLTSLRMLAVSGNKLQTLPDAINSLSRLTCLEAHNNPLTSLPCLGGLCSLKKLNIGSNNLAVLPLELSCLQALRVLTVDCISPDGLLLDSSLLQLPRLDCVQLDHASAQRPENQDVLMRLSSTKIKLDVVYNIVQQPGVIKLVYP